MITVISKGSGVGDHRKGDDMVLVTCPHDIMKHQENIESVDRGDQHRMMGVGFFNVSHIKNVIIRTNWVWMISIFSMCFHLGSYQLTS